MKERFKNLAWIVFGGYGIGIIVRRSWDSIMGIPNLVDVSLIDLDSILYGSNLIVLLLLFHLAVQPFTKYNPWVEAKKRWKKRFSNKKNLIKIPWIFLRGLKIAFLSTFIYFMLASIICVALAGKTDGDWLKIFLGWCGLVFFNWFFVMGTCEPTVGLEKNIAKLLGLPVKNGTIIVFFILVTFMFGIVIYPKVRQSFGGGKPEKAIVFLKQGHSATLPSLENIDGKMVNIVFRKGTKIGFQNIDSKNNNILVIDQEKIDRLYVGNKINEIDIEKLK